MSRKLMFFITMVLIGLPLAIVAWSGGCVSAEHYSAMKPGPPSACW